MSRTTLCVLTAAVLAVSSVGVMALRYRVLGNELEVPADPGTWKVTLAVSGKASDESRLFTALPLDFGKQHVLREACRSTELIDKASAVPQPTRRQVMWLPRAGFNDGPFRAHYEFYCRTNMELPTAPMTALANTLYAPPRSGQFLQSESGIDSDEAEVGELARRLTAGLARPQDQAEALFRFVDQEIANEPTVAGTSATARTSLQSESGDSRSKSRLLAALLRNRGIPARLVTGLTLARGREQAGHVWVEAWLHANWLSMCPFYHHYGKVPRTYLVFGFGDTYLVRGRGIRNLDYAFLVERLTESASDAPPPSWARRALTFCSFQSLPPAEQNLVEFLLLLPLAALIVCVFRNLIGMGSFGTFAPALLGLAFRELHSLPGILVFVSVVLTGWLLRRLLDRYHLLQVPRVALLLSLVVFVLIAAVVLASHRNLPATRYVSLFPIVILTGMIERFWTLEVEDGTGTSFRTLLCTMLIALTISLVLCVPAVVWHVYHYPETLGLIMAAQLLIGRYTGYRLSELYRFRDFLKGQAGGHAGPQIIADTIRFSDEFRSSLPRQ